MSSLINYNLITKMSDDVLNIRCKINTYVSRMEFLGYEEDEYYERLLKKARDFQIECEEFNKFAFAAANRERDMMIEKINIADIVEKNPKLKKRVLK